MNSREIYGGETPESQLCNELTEKIQIARALSTTGNETVPQYLAVIDQFPEATESITLTTYDYHDLDREVIMRVFKLPALDEPYAIQLESEQDIDGQLYVKERVYSHYAISRMYLDNQTAIQVFLLNPEQLYQFETGVYDGIAVEQDDRIDTIELLDEVRRGFPEPMRD